ncbi:hypothetical protein DIZ76_017155 [Coccidioides immitis]|nr:hypothetical protein DIZ76_017155 [Coccidioides immitis]
MMLSRRMLSKEDEEASHGEETEVRREDQEKINRFSRLHQRETALQEQLKTKQVQSPFTVSTPIAKDTLNNTTRKLQKDKEDLEEISAELDLADEDEPVPYKIGDSFISLPLPEAQALLTASSEQIDEEVSKIEGQLGELRDELQQLKVALYARFGRSINLET